MTINHTCNIYTDPRIERELHESKRDLRGYPWSDVYFHNHEQDETSEAWRALLVAIDETALSGGEMFNPGCLLGSELWGQIRILPSSIAKLVTVKQVVLYGSNLVQIPAEIGQMQKLESLDVISVNHMSASQDSVLKNRNLDGDKWDTTTERRRYIFTWNDLDNDGIVAPGEVFSLESKTQAEWDALTTDPTKRQSVLDDFNMADTTEMNNFINWYRGVDSIYEEDEDGDGFDSGDDDNKNGKQDYYYRCRRFPECVPPDPDSTDQELYENQEWRLGDVIHSTPTLVGQPAEGYHTVYRDPSYAWFVKKYRYRRNVVIFGANDGMMHTVNGGFFEEDKNKFWLEQSYNSETKAYEYSNNSNIKLGDEMWAYVPYNLQPHLKCLASDNYDHKYYVDQKPRVMDVKVFEPELACGTSKTDPDCIHPEGWGTILIGSMRFGGSEVEPGGVDNRRFISSYFILDITDPERPPTLLGEMSMTNEVDAGNKPIYADMGYTTPVPTGVVIRDNTAGDSAWYLVFGNGPATIKGENDQQGKIAVLPLVWLSSMTPNTDPKIAFRIPNEPPSNAASSNYGGIFSIPDDGGINEDTSFVGDLISADFNVESQADDTKGNFYKTDAVYFGTVDGSGFSKYNENSEESHWSGSGRLFRLVTQLLDADDKELTTTPDQWRL